MGHVARRPGGENLQLPVGVTGVHDRRGPLQSGQRLLRSVARPEHAVLVRLLEGRGEPGRGPAQQDEPAGQEAQARAGDARARLRVRVGRVGVSPGRELRRQGHRGQHLY